MTKLLTLAAGVAAAIGLTGCAAAVTEQPPVDPAANESETANPRLAISYDGGVLLLDVASLAPLVQYELDGFLRLNPAGDDRHVLVSTGEGFRVLDTGAWSDDHGDHVHHYLGEPELTDRVIPATEPGHVVPHHDTTALFADGSGEITVFDPADLEGDAELPTVVHALPDAHHGVAVQLSDGTLLATEGTHETRTAVIALDSGRDEIARTDDCPAVHGEAVAEGEVVSFGCADGAVLFTDDAFTKVDSPDPGAGIGTQAGSEESAVLLTDYAVDGATEPSTRVGLLDTEAFELRTVDLGTAYSFRSLGRGPAGEALVLGTDGALHVIDAASGARIESLSVVDAWTEPDDWQQPRPALTVLDALAFITEPATSTLHVIDLTTLQVVESTELPVVPNEIVAIRG